MKTKSVLVGKLVVIMLLLSSVFGSFWYGKPTSAKTKTITIEKGKTYKLKVKKGRKIKCSNVKVATVTKKGKIKAVKKGKCTIKVIKGKKVKKYNICVNDTYENDNDNSQTTDNQLQNPAPTPTGRPLVGYVLLKYLTVEKIEQKDDQLSTVYLVCEKPITGLISDEQFQNGVKYVRLDVSSSRISEKGIVPGDNVAIGFGCNSNMSSSIVDNNTVVLAGRLELCRAYQ